MIENLDTTRKNNNEKQKKKQTKKMRILIKIPLNSKKSDSESSN